ncbi:MAG: site-specific integrase [Bryobacterales bacterium]|nr:site-specific integrase [Bryobacterales bacterium]
MRRKGRDGATGAPVDRRDHEVAVAQGYGVDNPAGDALGAALRKTSVAKRHRCALSHSKVVGSIATVRESRAHWATVAALEYLILTAARSGEVREARWDEVDLGTATWTVPADRMKMQREHRVPLSDRALQILAEACRRADGTGLIFPSVTGRALSDNTLSKLLREQGIPAVVHGFRSSFRDWCAECSNAPRKVSELALAHVNSDRVEAAYMRTDLFERRRGLMQSWADYVSKRGLER